MSQNDTLAIEFQTRLTRSRTDSDGLRKRGALYVRDLTGRPPEGQADDPKAAPVAPLNYAWKEALNPVILDRDPVPCFKDSDSDDPIKRQRALVFEKLSEYLWTQQCIRRNVIEVALEQAESHGLGPAITAFDPIDQLPRVTFVPVRDYDVDLDAKHPDLRFVRWMSVKKCIPLASARQMWSGFDFVTDATMASDKPADGGYKVKDFTLDNAPGESSAGNQTVTVHCVFVRGDDPYRGDAAKAPTKREGDVQKPEGALFGHGESRVLYFAYAKVRGTQGDGKMVKVGEELWTERHMLPKRDQFPISVLRLTIDTEGYWPRSMFDPVRGAADQANWAAKFEDDDARMSVKRLVLVDKRVMDKKKAEALFKGGVNLEVHSVDSVTAAEQGVKVFDFVKPNAIAANNSDRSMQRFEMAARLQDLTPQARSHESSSGARLRAEISGAKTGRPESLLTEFAADITQKLLQCARLHMTADQVAAIVGEPMLQFVTEPVMEDGEVSEIDPETGETRMVPGKVPVIGEDGQPKFIRYSKVWNEDATPLDILAETDLYIDPASMRRLDKEAELQKLVQIKQMILGDVTFMTQLGTAPVPDALARMLFGFTARVGELMGVTDMALLMPNPDEMFQFMPPDQAQGGGAEAMPNANGPNEAAEGGAEANPPGS